MKSDDAKAKLLISVYEKVKEKYGQVTPLEVKNRIERELRFIAEKGLAEKYLFMSLLTERSKASGYPSNVRGIDGSLFIAYLIGATDVNPLPPHYYCRECGCFEFADEGEYMVGEDLPDKMCPDCYRPLSKDGYNIPCEVLTGGNRYKTCVIELNIACGYLSEAEKHLEEILGKENVYTAIPTLNEDNGGRGYILAPDGDNGGRKYEWEKTCTKVNFIPCLASDAIFKLSRVTGIDPHTVPLNDAAVLEMVFSGDVSGIPEFDSAEMSEIIRISKPEKIDDLIRAAALRHGTGTWNHNAGELLQSGVIKIRDVISTRDDIMNYLLSQGMDPDRVFIIMENVRKGRGITPEMEKDMRTAGIPEWYIGSAKKIHYLWPRADVAARVRNALILSYFRKYYPDEFKKVMNKVL